MMYLGKDPVGLATSIPEFGNIANVECGTFTLTEDTLIQNYKINHNFGVRPDFGYCFAITHFLDDISQFEKNYAVQLVLSTWASDKDQDYYGYTNNYAATSFGLSMGGARKSDIANTSSINFSSGNKTVYFKANITYFYIIGKFKEVTQNANE